MEKLSMKTVDIGLQTTGKTKSAVQTGDVSGDCDFRKLLQNKSEDTQGSQNKQDSKEVSKDQDASQDKTETVEDTKKDTVSKDEGQTEKTDSNETDTSQAEAMLAAQMRERFSYGFTVTVPETEESANVQGIEVPVMQTETAMEEVPQMAVSNEEDIIQTQPELESQMQQVQAPETARVQSAQESKNTEMPDQATNVKTAEQMPVTHTENASETKQETSDFSSQMKDTAKTSQAEEKNETQTGNFAAEQAASAAVKPENVNASQPEEIRPVTTARVYVEQPEELPEKVTDQLLSKLTDGVQEFEIHIEPANLGKIAVKVLYEGTQATISIICSEKRTMDLLGQNAREIGNIIERNLGGETTIIVDKQETDYLNQTRDENEQSEQNAKQQKEEKSQNQDGEDAEQFLQRLRLGLAG